MESYIPLAITMLFIVFDYVSGICKAFANKNVDSSIMRKGLWHKFSYILIIVLAVMIEWGMGYLDFGFTVPIVIPVCVYIIVTEIASILENIVEINPDLGDMKFLELFKAKEIEESIKEKLEAKELKND